MKKYKVIYYTMDNSSGSFCLEGENEIDVLKKFSKMKSSSSRIESISIKETKE